MRAPVRLAGFAVAIAVVFAAALGVGRLVGSDGDDTAAGDTAATHDMGEHGAEESGAHSHEAAVPGGLMTAQDGFRLMLDEPIAHPGQGQPVTFHILGPDGAPVTSYGIVHEKQLHLIAVRRDLTGFQHVHPTLAADGTWTTALDLTPGSWRVFADSQPAGGSSMTLGADLQVPGDFQPVPPGPDTRVASVDGYEVRLEGELSAHGDSVLTPRVTKDGADVTDQLEPYLGALGHLVALRRGDLAYLHVHPDGLDFHASVPSEGGYQLFLDFQLAGVVRTAAFTLTAGDEHGH